MSDNQWDLFDEISDELSVQIVLCCGGYCLVDRYELKTPVSPCLSTQDEVGMWLIENQNEVAFIQAASARKVLGPFSILEAA